MAVRITYFVHGTTADNEREISSGWSDPGLSAEGVKQAAALRGKIKGKAFDAVFSSDLRRADDSARLAFGRKTRIIQDRRLRECNYGDYNGQPSRIVEPLQETSIIKKFPHGESYNNVKKRMISFLGFLRKHYRGRHVALVSHKAPQLALEVILKNKTWKQAFADDWRKKKAWQPGWEYIVK